MSIKCDWCVFVDGGGGGRCRRGNGGGGIGKGSSPVRGRKRNKGWKGDLGWKKRDKSKNGREE